jgi:hypothetical protein
MKKSSGFKNSFIGGIIAVIIYLTMASPYLFFRYAPRELFFDYQAIIPATTQVGKTLEFISVRRVGLSRPFIAYEDLTCKFNDTYVQVKERVVTYVPKRVVTYSESNVWQYPYMPTRPGECFIESFITMRLPFNVERSQLIIEHFQVEP